jgi:hypothetical protein
MSDRNTYNLFLWIACGYPLNDLGLLLGRHRLSRLFAKGLAQDPRAGLFSWSFCIDLMPSPSSMRGSHTLVAESRGSGAQLDVQRKAKKIDMIQLQMIAIIRVEHARYSDVGNAEALVEVHA